MYENRPSYLRCVDVLTHNVMIVLSSEATSDIERFAMDSEFDHDCLLTSNQLGVSVLKVGCWGDVPDLKWEQSLEWLGRGGVMSRCFVCKEVNKCELAPLFMDVLIPFHRIRKPNEIDISILILGFLDSSLASQFASF